MLHPAAWWVWALGMATAASRTTNPLLLGLIVGVVAFVVVSRRTDAPWAKGFKYYLTFGLVIIAVRVGFRILLDASSGTILLFTLPEIPLPDAAAGIKLGGPVYLEPVLAAVYDGLRLATLLCCIGAANVLANPKRLLKAVPAALHEVGVAVTVTLTVAPQLVESARRIHRARQLRGGTGGGRRSILRGVLVPLLTDALDRSLLLAAAMDSRGYGRRAAVTGGSRVLSGTLVLLGLMGACVGTYGLLDAGAPPALGIPMLLVGLLLAGAGFVLAGKRVERTSYRPDPWRLAEWGVAATGLAVVTVTFIGGSVDPTNLNPSLQPLSFPEVGLVLVAGVLIGALPAVIAPPPPLGEPGPSPIDHPAPVDLPTDRTSDERVSGAAARSVPPGPTMTRAGHGVRSARGAVTTEASTSEGRSS